MNRKKLLIPGIFVPFFSITLVILAACGLTACGAGGGGTDAPLTATVLQNDEVIAAAEEENFNLPPQNAEGWSVFTPSADSRIIYVSDTFGNDTTGQAYSSSDPEVGSDPFLPAGNVQAFKTITAALASARGGFPDWVLLRRGDSWDRTTPINFKSGRSLQERFLISSYGTSTQRPLVKTGTTDGVRFWREIHFAGLIGVHFYAHKRDPDNTAFVGFENIESPLGFYGYASGGTYSGHSSILIEDCAFDFYGLNYFQGDSPSVDIIVRRNLITNNYNVNSHSQGMYATNVSILLEDNLFDHNGWYKQSYIALNNRSEGQATYFNHNIYFSNFFDTVIRGNLFLRSSSIGNKFTANPKGSLDEILTDNILVEDNLYVEGEIGISAGGNTDNGNGHRFRNMIIRRNVLLDLGRSRPTNRSLGWGIQVIDWDSGVVSDNIFSHYGSQDVSSIYALKIDGHVRNLTVATNVFSGLYSNGYVVEIDGDPKSDIVFSGNEFQMQGTRMSFIDTAYSEATYVNNTYYSDQVAKPFGLNSNTIDFENWQSATNSSESLELSISYTDPNRNVDSYMSSLGRAPNLSAFIEEAKLQSRNNWRPEFTARAVNEYVRAGFER